MFLLLTVTTNNTSAHPITIVNVKRPALNAWGGLVWVGHGVDMRTGQRPHPASGDGAQRGVAAHPAHRVSMCEHEGYDPGRDRGESRHLEAGGCLSMRPRSVGYLGSPRTPALRAVALAVLNVNNANSSSAEPTLNNVRTASQH